MLSWENCWPDYLRRRLVKGETDGRQIHVYEGMAESMYHALCRMAAALPDKGAVVDGRGQSLSYGELLKLTDRMAAALREEAGIQKGEHIGLILYNGIEFCVSYLAANKIGAVVVPLPGKFQKPELLPLALKARLRLIICEKKYQDWFGGLEGLRILTVKEGPGFGLDWFCCGYRDCGNARPSGGWSDSAILMFTSGTTSRSKGVSLKNYQIMNSVEAYIATLGLSREDRSVIATPIYHVTGMICILSVFLTVGGTVFLMEKVDPDRILACFLENQITFYHASPTVFAMLLEKRDSYPFIPSLKAFACGSGNMAPETIRKLKEWMPQARFHTVYGLTETAGAGAIFPVGAADSPWIGASGIPMPDLQIKILDDDSRELAEGEIGEICVKGSFVAEGYYMQETDSLMEGGWLRTGDLGYYNQAGYLYIVDRKKDMINRGGEKICSFDIENAIHDLPGVAEAVVVGVPDAKYMEVPAAMVRVKKGFSLREEDMREMLKTRMARYKIPGRFIFVEDIPKTHNGKVDKRAIKEWMKGAVDGKEAPSA